MRRMTRHPALVLALALTAATAGCGGSDEPAHRAATTTSTAAAPATPPVNTTAAIRAARPETTFTSVFFRPKMHLKLPRGWTGNDLDAHSLPVFPGDDEMAAQGEITFVSDLARRPLDEVVARLHAARGAHPTPIVRQTVGHYRAFRFDVRSRGTVTFEPIGIHTVPGDQLRVVAFRANGRTIAAFEFVGKGRDAAAFHAAADRVLRTVTVG